MPRCDHIRHAENLTHLLEEMCHKRRPVAGQLLLWGSVLKKQMLGEGDHDVVCRDPTMWNGLCEPFEAVRDEEDERKTPLVLGEGPEDVDGDRLEPPFGREEREGIQLSDKSHHDFCTLCVY